MFTGIFQFHKQTKISTNQLQLFQRYRDIRYRILTSIKVPIGIWKFGPNIFMSGPGQDNGGLKVAGPTGQSGLSNVWTWTDPGPFLYDRPLSSLSTVQLNTLRPPALANDRPFQTRPGSRIRPENLDSVRNLDQNPLAVIIYRSRILIGSRIFLPVYIFSLQWSGAPW